MQGAGIKVLAAGGAVQTVVQPLKQMNAVMAFQLLNGPGYRGLGHVQLFGGAGNVHLLIHGYKNPHMLNGHGSITSISKNVWLQ